MMRDRIVFYLNGKKRELRLGDSGAGGDASSSSFPLMLADYLRYQENLTGTKIVCAEGDCGACTVLRYFPGPARRSGLKPIFLPINACITPVELMDGSSLVTIEALRDLDLDPNSGLTPVQEQMRRCHASQCGFCTPGMVMALTGLIEKKLRATPRSRPISPITDKNARNALTGNLCRCTGYQPIIDAAVSVDLSRCSSIQSRFLTPRQERELREVLSRPIEAIGKEYSFYAPTTLRQAAAYLRKHRDSRLIAGGTDLGVAHNKRKLRLTRLVSLHLIPELHAIRTLGSGRISVGGRVTLAELRTYTRGKIPEFSHFLDLFASPQIKNLATLAGNVGNASPIADTPPFLLVAGAKLTVIGPKGKRTVPLENFYKGYRKTALAAGEFIAAIEFDIPSRAESLSLHKVSQRKDLDISTVNAAFRIRWTDRGKKRIASARIAFGGVAAIPLRLPKTERALRGAELKPAVVAQAAAILQSEITPISDLRGSAAFRRVVAGNLFRRFFQENTIQGAADPAPALLEAAGPDTGDSDR